MSATLFILTMAIGSGAVTVMTEPVSSSLCMRYKYENEQRYENKRSGAVFACRPVPAVHARPLTPPVATPNGRGQYIYSPDYPRHVPHPYRGSERAYAPVQTSPYTPPAYAPQVRENWRPPVGVYQAYRYEQTQQFYDYWSAQRQPRVRLDIQINK